MAKIMDGDTQQETFEKSRSILNVWRKFAVSTYDIKKIVS